MNESLKITFDLPLHKTLHACNFCRGVDQRKKSIFLLEWFVSLKIRVILRTKLPTELKCAD